VWMCQVRTTPRRPGPLVLENSQEATERASLAALQRLLTLNSERDALFDAAAADIEDQLGRKPKASAKKVASLDPVPVVHSAQEEWGDLLRDVFSK